MNTRIAAVRKSLNLTQEQFGKKIGISKNYVNLIENGKKNPGDRLITDMCREFNINKSWLKYGTGPQYIETDTLTKYMATVAVSNDDFIEDILAVYLELDPQSRKALRIAADNFAAKRQSRIQKEQD